MEATVFMFYATPTKASKHYNKYTHAYIDTWVNEKNKKIAKTMAESYLMDYGWQVIKVESVQVITAAQLHQYDKPSQSSFYRSMADGIYANISAIDPSLPLNTSYLTSLNSPHIKSTKKH